MMSNLATDPRFDALTTRDAEIAPGFFVHRMLPTRARRTIGAWCFLDHYGPVDIASNGGMRVAQHPHTGLQTVTWLFEGTGLHRDSLGNEQIIAPGQLNLMTSGRGIAHAEFSPPSAPPRLHGLQLWIALPDSDRQTAPAFEHHADLPVIEIGSMEALVLIGSFAGVRSAARAFSPLAGVQLRLSEGKATEVPLDPAFEYGIVLVDGAASADGNVLSTRTLYDLGAGRASLTISGEKDSHLMLLGGAPLGEKLLMWWNFVARTPDEIAQARAEWEGGTRFGRVSGGGTPIAAPALMPGLRAT